MVANSNPDGDEYPHLFETWAVEDWATLVAASNIQIGPTSFGLPKASTFHALEKTTESSVNMNGPSRWARKVSQPRMALVAVDTNDPDTLTMENFRVDGFVGYGNGHNHNAPPREFEVWSGGATLAQCTKTGRMWQERFGHKVGGVVVHVEVMEIWVLDPGFLPP